MQMVALSKRVIPSERKKTVEDQLDCEERTKTNEGRRRKGKDDELGRDMRVYIHSRRGGFRGRR